MRLGKKERDLFSEGHAYYQNSKKGEMLPHVTLDSLAVGKVSKVTLPDISRRFLMVTPKGEAVKRPLKYMRRPK